MRYEPRVLQFYVRTNTNLVLLPDTVRGRVAQDVSFPLRRVYGINMALAHAIVEGLGAL